MQDIGCEIIVDTILCKEDRFCDSAREEANSFIENVQSPFTQLDELLKCMEELGTNIGEMEHKKVPSKPVVEIMKQPRVITKAFTEKNFGEASSKIFQPGMDVRWEGYLKKRSDWLKHWETYYFVLHGNVLCCYLSEQDARRRPEQSKIKDGIFTFSDRVKIRKVMDVPSSIRFDPTIPYRMSCQSVEVEACLDTLSEKDRKELAALARKKGLVPNAHRFDFEIANGKVIHLQASNEATKQVWMHVASDGILNDSVNETVRNAVQNITVGLNDFYLAYEFFIQSLCQINDNQEKPTMVHKGSKSMRIKRQKSAHACIGSGLPMPGASIMPRIDRIISRMFSILHPDVVLKTNYLPMVPFAGSYRGHYGVLSYFSILAHTIQCTQFHVSHIAMDGDVAVITGTETLLIRISNTKFKQTWVQKLYFSPNGRIKKLEILGDAIGVSMLFSPKWVPTELKLPRLEESNDELPVAGELTVTLRIDSVDGTRLDGFQSLYIKCSAHDVAYTLNKENEFIKKVQHVQGATTTRPWSPSICFQENIVLHFENFSKDSTILHVSLHTLSGGSCIAFTEVNLESYIKSSVADKSESAVPSVHTSHCYVLSNQYENFVGKISFDVDINSQDISNMAVLSPPRKHMCTLKSFNDCSFSFNTEGVNSPNFNEFEYKKTIVSNSCFEIYAKYEIVKLIGRGAFGVVVAAYDVVHGGAFAIKKISDFARTSKLAVLSFREIKLMHILGQHPAILGIHELHIPSCYSTFRDLYIVQPLMETDLCSLIHSRVPISDEHVQYILYQLLCGIRYMHSANVLHRDIKPSNILANSDCSIAICDLGLARHLKADIKDDLELSEYVVTRWYRAPELLLANVYEKSIDIWSIGCVFAELLGRRIMFPGRSYVDQLKLIMRTVGTPKTFSFCDNPSARRYAGREFLVKGQTYEKIPWTTIFANVNPVALDLLDHMLTFDPRDRISATDALAHPYLSSWKEPQLEKQREDLDIKTNFDYKTLSSEKLRRLIFHEISTGYFESTK